MWLAGSIAGLLFGLALFRRRSLGDAVQAHATTNLLLVIYAVTTGRWSAWS
jgi:membrane protease YdiL (CAAX protease family)